MPKVSGESLESARGGRGNCSEESAVSDPLESTVKVRLGLALGTPVPHIHDPMEDKHEEWWFDGVFEAFQHAGIEVVGYLPDAGLKELILRCQEAPEVRAVPLTTEEEGVGLAMGAWLGGRKSALLLQSSGVGNVINALGACRACAFPLVLLVTMRGEKGEFNPWQVPVGRAVSRLLETMDVRVFRASNREAVVEAVENALSLAYEDSCMAAVLVSQAFLGVKRFRDEVEEGHEEGHEKGWKRGGEG